MAEKLTERSIRKERRDRFRELEERLQIEERRIREELEEERHRQLLSEEEAARQRTEQFVRSLPAAPLTQEESGEYGIRRDGEYRTKEESIRSEDGPRSKSIHDTVSLETKRLDLLFKEVESHHLEEEIKSRTAEEDHLLRQSSLQKLSQRSHIVDTTEERLNMGTNAQEVWNPQNMLSSGRNSVELDFEDRGSYISSRSRVKDLEDRYLEPVISSRGMEDRFKLRSSEKQSMQVEEQSISGNDLRRRASDLETANRRQFLIREELRLRQQKSEESKMSLQKRDSMFPHPGYDESTELKKLSTGASEQEREAEYNVDRQDMLQREINQKKLEERKRQMDEERIKERIQKEEALKEKEIDKALKGERHEDEERIYEEVLRKEIEREFQIRLQQQRRKEQEERYQRVMEKKIQEERIKREKEEDEKFEREKERLIEKMLQQEREKEMYLQEERLQREKERRLIQEKLQREKERRALELQLEEEKARLRKELEREMLLKELQEKNEQDRINTRSKQRMEEKNLLETIRELKQQLQHSSENYEERMMENRLELLRKEKEELLKQIDARERIASHTRVPEVDQTKPDRPFGKPKLPQFDGNQFEEWKLEVNSLIESRLYTENILTQAIRNSITGKARRVLLTLKASASSKEIMKKMEDIYGIVKSGDAIVHDFYSAKQSKEESCAEWGLRLETIFSQAEEKGEIQESRKDAKLKERFWRGLYSEKIKLATRLSYESTDSFDMLRRKARIEENEMVPVKSKINTSVSTETPMDLTSDPKSYQPIQTRSATESKLDTLLKKIETLEASIEELKLKDRKLEESTCPQSQRGRYPYRLRGYHREQNWYTRGQSYGRGRQRDGNSASRWNWRRGYSTRQEPSMYNEKKQQSDKQQKEAKPLN